MTTDNEILQIIIYEKVRLRIPEEPIIMTAYELDKILNEELENESI